MLFIKYCSCCPAFILNGAGKALPCKSMAQPVLLELLKGTSIPAMQSNGPHPQVNYLCKC